MKKLPFIFVFSIAFVCLTGKASIIGAQDPGFTTCLFFPSTKDCEAGVSFCGEHYIAPSNHKELCDEYDGDDNKDDCEGLHIACVPEPCGELDQICCSNGECFCNEPYVPSEAQSLDCSYCTCLAQLPCGGVDQKCCGDIPPASCNAPFIPSDEADPESCWCFDSTGFRPPPVGSNCISYPTDGSRCSGGTSYPCVGDDHTWCCPEFTDCVDAEVGPWPTPVVIDRGLCGVDSHGRYHGVITALGCIITETPEDFVGSMLRILIIIGGAIAFFLILFGAFQILTSTGNPERIQAGKELITAAISGLALIIFTIFVLRTIGVELLKLPDFIGP